MGNPSGAGEILGRTYKPQRRGAPETSLGINAAKIHFTIGDQLITLTMLSAQAVSYNMIDWIGKAFMDLTNIAAWRISTTQFALAFFCAALSAVTYSHAAGLANVDIPATATEPALKVSVWTPCAEAGGEVKQGPFTLKGVKNCDVSGKNLPLIVISHGQGGSRFGHHDSAAALADAGFVVASFNHPGDAFDDRSATNHVAVFEARPQHVTRVISHMLAQWTYRRSLNAQSVGVFGFSRGGYTALTLAGAIPSLSASSERFCASWSAVIDPMCWRVKFGNAQLAPKADARVKAIVAADPLNLFDDAGLRSIRIPVQLWASELGGAGITLAHTQAIKAGLTQTPEWHIANGAGHFVFLAPCPEALRQEAEEICEDPKGVDRKAFHTLMNQAVVAFFKKHLVSID
jgi:predicted dienelactone hydrolase